MTSEPTSEFSSEIVSASPSEDTSTLGADTGMKAHEINFLQELFCNSESFVFDDDTITSLSKVQEVQIPETLRIALFSLRMPNPREIVEKYTPPNRKYPVGVHPEYVRVSFSKKNNILKPDEIVDEIGRILSHYDSPKNPLHFMLLNELALSYENSEYLLDTVTSKFGEKKASSTIGILGSFHCQNSHFNVAPIISPFMDASPKHELANCVVKQSTAVKQGEQIRTPDGTNLVRFKTPYGVIAVWICLDIYDPNMVSKLIRNNYRLAQDYNAEYGIDLLFIPSYNWDDRQRVKNIARQISEFARLTVFVCNDSTNCTYSKGHPIKTPWNDNFCFSFGEEIKPAEVDNTGKGKLSIFEIKDWAKNKEEVSTPYSFSSEFKKILALTNTNQKRYKD